MSLAFAPLGWFPVAVVAPAVLFLLWDDATPRRAARMGFWFGAGTFLVGAYWLYHSIHIIGKAPMVLAIIVLVLGVASAAMNRGRPDPGPRAGEMTMQDWEKLKEPVWYSWASAVSSAAGVLIGASLLKRKDGATAAR